MNRFSEIIVVAVAAGSLCACGAREQASEAKPREALAVSVTRVGLVDAVERFEAGGVVAAQEAATLSSRMTATIAGVRVKAGDRIRVGDVLVTLDAQDVTAHAGQARATALAAEKSLTQARAELQAAEAEHRLASAWQKRITQLHARNSATEQEHDEAESRFSAAAARRAAAEAAVDGAEAQLAAARAGLAVAAATESYATLRAPFDGIVTERLIDPGNLASPGIPLLRVESDGARQIMVRVDEARAAYIQPGDRVRVVIEGLENTGGDAGGFEGVVAEVARAVGADQRAFTVKVSLARSVTARSGTFARVVFSGAPRRALLIPTNAIRRQGQVSTVFVVQNAVARVRLVQTGAATSNGIEVLAGLDAGESIVTSTSPNLTDGSPVVARGVVTPSGGRP